MTCFTKKEMKVLHKSADVCFYEMSNCNNELAALRLWTNGVSKKELWYEEIPWWGWWGTGLLIGVLGGVSIGVYVVR